MSLRIETDSVWLCRTFCPHAGVELVGGDLEDLGEENVHWDVLRILFSSRRKLVLVGVLLSVE